MNGNFGNQPYTYDKRQCECQSPPRGGGGWGKNAGEGGEEWTTMEPNSEIKLVRVSETRGNFPCSLFNAKLGFWARGLFTCVWDFHVFDSESFELELNGSAWDTSGSRFVQIPSVVLEIRFRPMYTVSGLPKHGPLRYSPLALIRGILEISPT